MNRRILVIEPDATLRQMMEYALAAAGFAPIGVPTIEASRSVLDGKPVEMAVVEMRATNTEGVDGVRALRADYPELPLVATGTLLTPRAMRDLIRARVDDVIPKPFGPRELSEVVERVLEQTRTRNDGALEYAAAMAAARRALVEGRPRDAISPLERAHATSPLDAEAMGLFALVKELEGDDHAASRGYRAALALEDERVTEEGFPRDGLARLQAYAGAKAVPSFEHRGKHRLWFVGDAAAELAEGLPTDASPDVIVFTLGLTPNEFGAIYSRVGGDKRAFLIATSALGERLVARIASNFEAPEILAVSRTRQQLGLPATASSPTTSDTRPA
jgi:DNA-binding NarL/FixJ family response regulator